MRNPFKASLKRGDKLIGLWLSLANPYSTEVCATAGFHWMLVDNEHAPNDVRSTLAQLQAVAAYASHPVVRARAAFSEGKAADAELGGGELALDIDGTAMSWKGKIGTHALQGEARLAAVVS